MTDKPLTKPQEKAIRALCAGANRKLAYIAGYPLAARWSDHLLTAKADKLFDSDPAKIFQKSLVGSQEDGSAEPVPEEDKRTMKPKHPGGRPSLYTATVLKKSRKYIADYEDYDDLIPSIAGLSVILGVRRETLHAWDRDPDKEEFSHILDELRATQERVLINKGLVGTFNPTIAKLVLGKHGYHERQSHEVTGGKGGPIETITGDMTPERASEIYQECMHKG